MMSKPGIFLGLSLPDSPVLNTTGVETLSGEQCADPAGFVWVHLASYEQTGLDADPIPNLTQSSLSEMYQPTISRLSFCIFFHRKYFT